MGGPPLEHDLEASLTDYHESRCRNCKKLFGRTVRPSDSPCTAAPPYSTDIAAAWRVVDLLCVPEKVILHLAGPYLPVSRQYMAQGAPWAVWFATCAPTEADFIGGDTPAHAICLAALEHVKR